MILIISLSIIFCVGQSLQTKSNLTLDDFFNNTEFASLSFSPTGQHLLYQTMRPAWNSNAYEYTLWVYNIDSYKKTSIISTLGYFLSPRWSPSGNTIAFIHTEYLLSNSTDDHQRLSEKSYYIYFYSVLTEELHTVENTLEKPSTFAWSDQDSSLFLVTSTSRFVNNDEDILPYRERINNHISTIHRLDFDWTNDRPSLRQFTPIITIPLRLSDFLYVPLEQKLIFLSTSPLIDDLNSFEIYSIDLRNQSLLTRLTHNQGFEIGLQLSPSGNHLLFRNYTRRSSRTIFHDTQRRLYSLDLANGHTERYGSDFLGNIVGYVPKSDGGVYFLGQHKTNVGIYTQQSLEDTTVHHLGWEGTYEHISSSINRPQAIAFAYSSFDRPKEIYYVDDIKQLQFAKAITNENQHLTERIIPKATVYQWKDEVSNETIEGILHYPPGKDQEDNLPLFVLMHGGPYDASVNSFFAGWYTWAPLAAAHGWLVLEPNFRGSSGYGDEFLDEIRRQPLTRSTRDIISGVDQLIKDGIVDSNRLTIGGYSYGGFLTNWIITQTDRFNAALSGSGSIDHTSSWGTMDLPVLFHHLFGGYPWDESHIYQTQSPIFQLDRIRTPTLIVTGEKDIRVDPAQSYMLERSLHYLGVPVNLIVFPGEGHELSVNPWHGKIKVREELKWLQKYGHRTAKFY
ncbi:unnamed protein product [Adineta ricciae]|uniref:Peptidase S9 prolyl oligopeptidase catalytic domain-containing protein n=1 Tax=Adineta ricciae TaxID=249248 RepID=A0A815AUI8_ADIRI|nr:unnamed protein product [Adineta ricciae]